MIAGPLEYSQLRNPAGGALASALAKTLREYSLAASTAVSGEYPTIVETRGGASLVQTDADRKPAAATAANGLAVATFDGSDVLLQTLESGNNSTSQWWMNFWVKPADFAASQQILSAMVASGASANRCRASIVNTTGFLVFDLFASGFNGHGYTSGTALSAASWNNCCLCFDGSKTAACDTDGLTEDAKIRLWINGAFCAVTESLFGTGGTHTALLAATGVATLGGGTDSDTPSLPMRNGGQIGPRMRFGAEPLTAAELAAINAFEVPT
jgi:hypothetical protein